MYIAPAALERSPCSAAPGVAMQRIVRFLRNKKSPAEAGLFEAGDADDQGFAAGFASGLPASGLPASGFASGFFAGGFGCVPTASTVTRRFGARHSISCFRFILFEQNFVTGIGCLNALPSQKMSFGSMPLLTM